MCRYREDPQWLRHWIPRCRVTIYDKGETPIDLPCEVVRLPNLGREGQAWVHHIISRWDSLSETTVFLQARPDYVRVADLPWMIARALDRGDRFTPLFPRPPLVCDQGGRPERKEGDFPIVACWRRLFPQDDCPARLTFCPGGQFLVRREAILRRDISFFKECDAILSVGVDPPEGYAMERLWPYIFGQP